MIIILHLQVLATILALLHILNDPYFTLHMDFLERTTSWLLNIDPISYSRTLAKVLQDLSVLVPVARLNCHELRRPEVVQPKDHLDVHPVGLAGLRSPATNRRRGRG